MFGAVLLGDLIRSSRKDPETVDATMRELVQAVGSLGKIAGENHFTRFRGDGWQLVTLRPEISLRIALAMIARLGSRSALSTRIAIGIGNIDDLAGGNLGAASGSAFLRSGQLLDQMSPKRRIVLAGAPSAAAPWVDGLLHLLEFIAERWSPPQAEAIEMALAPGWDVQADLAARLGITKQAIGSRLKGAGYPAVASALDAFEKFGWERPQ
jgi:hypothetical protein